MIKDTTSPILKAPDTITVEATSESANIVNIGEAKASDLVGIQSITNDAPDVFSLGLTTVTWTATDVSGLSYSAIQKITVVDTTSPVLTVPADIVIEAVSATNNPVEIGQATANDLLHISSITNNAPPTFQLGETIVTWAATDQSGNSVIDAQKVTVIDTTAPTIIIPDDVTIEASSQTNNIVSFGDAKADDNVGVTTITNDAPAAFAVGETIVIWTATDAAGNISTASQTVTIVDTTKPSVLSPEDISVEATDPLQNFVTLGNSTTSDAVGVITITNDAPDTFPFGETIVTWTATDPSGNSASDIQTITVIDMTSPKLSVPDNVIIDATSLETIVSIGKATATDIIDSNPTITNNAPSVFPLGETIVTWNVTDQFGNSENLTQIITVQACNKPVSSYNSIIGGPDDDTLTGTNLADLIFGLTGNDIISGEEGDDCIIAGDGDDIIFGNNGEDKIVGDNGNDIIRGGSGEDKINGNSGFDIIDGGDDHDSCNVGENTSDDVVTKCEAGKL